MRRNLALVVSVAVVLVGNACTPGSGGPDTVGSGAVTTTSASVESASTPLTSTTVGTGSVPADGAPEVADRPVPEQVTGVAPDEVIQDVFAAAESFTGADRSELELLRAEAVTWNDGALGCPEPGSSYTQALVEGYWVQLAFGESILDFRVNDRGNLKMCDRPGIDPGSENDS